MIIGIGGGIGSGKSIVSRILRLKNCNVYDCDYEAKRIMADDRRIKERIRDEISPKVTDGLSIPDRKILADIVFNDESVRLRLNKIVHAAILEDVMNRSREYPVLWVEAAILAESGLAAKCDRIWKVVASPEMRIANIMRRDRYAEEHARSRMNAQLNEEKMLRQYECQPIFNDSEHSVLEQVNLLLKQIIC